MLPSSPGGDEVPNSETPSDVLDATTTPSRQPQAHLTHSDITNSHSSTQDRRTDDWRRNSRSTADNLHFFASPETSSGAQERRRGSGPSGNFGIGVSMSSPSESLVPSDNSQATVIRNPLGRSTFPFMLPGPLFGSDSVRTVVHRRTSLGDHSTEIPRDQYPPVQSSTVTPQSLSHLPDGDENTISPLSFSPNSLNDPVSELDSSPETSELTANTLLPQPAHVMPNNQPNTPGPFPEINQGSDLSGNGPPNVSNGNEGSWI